MGSAGVSDFDPRAPGERLKDGAHNCTVAGHRTIL